MAGTTTILLAPPCLVSVVIPTRNRSALLARTLRSVLAQRDVAVRAIVVDDGSRDDTSDMLARLGDERVTVIHHPESRGVSVARNAGMAVATGEWVAFLDDDDLWSPAKLAEQVQAAEREGRSWACSGSVTFIDAGTIVAGAPPPEGTEIAETLPARNCVPAGASNVIARRSALRETGGFHPGLRHMADWDLWIRLASLGPPAVVHEPAVAYRLHESNASADSEVIDREIAIIEARGTALGPSARVDRAFIHRWTAWNLLRAGNRRAALRAYARAVGEGDLVSLGRAAVALVDPQVARRTLDRHAPDPTWATRAQAWLEAAAA